MCDEDEQLVRYYFGDLPDDERAAFEQRLADEPALAARLKTFAECVENHDAPCCGDEAPEHDDATPEAAEVAPPVELPRDLAGRTANAILSGHWERAAECVGRKRFCLAEVLAVGVVALLLGALLFPALVASRESSRRLACANNLGEMYHGLALYAADHGSRFPEIGPAQNAGLFTVALTDAGYVDRDWLSHLLVCSSSELAQQVADKQVRVVVPTQQALDEATAAQLWQLRRLMAGSYAYRIGYMNDGRYVFPKCRVNCRTALMADAPLEPIGVTGLTGAMGSAGGAVLSRNHGDCGQNVLFEDGHVSFVSGCWAPDNTDHLYLNDASQIAAGSHPGDVVLAPSEATPLGVPLLLLGY